MKSTTELLHLHTTIGDIDTTSNHSFYVLNKGWVAVGDLEIGDEIYALDGSSSLVIGWECEKLEEAITVYNLEVEDYHTYFVGDTGVLVHNQYDAEGGTETGGQKPKNKYEKAEYHGDKNNALKNKAPNMGQEALDHSVSISPNTTRRVGISDGEIVVFDETTNGIFHGHVRLWSELSEPMKAALRKAGMVTKKGKIIQ